jgi:hypothetical protein
MAPTFNEQRSILQANSHVILTFYLRFALENYGI